MSICNVVLAPERAVVAVDTLSGAMAQAPGETAAAARIRAALMEGIHVAKADYLPHIGCVLVHRGDMLAGTTVGAILRQSAPADFDAAVVLMPQAAATAYAQAQAVRKATLGNGTAAGLELVLVGWSPQLGRMQGVRWTRWPQDKGFNVAPIARCVLLPDAEWATDPAVPESDADLLQVARDQVAYVQRRFPDGSYVCGGRLLVTAITQGRMETHVAGDL